MTICIGVDPGKDGGLASICPGRHAQAIPMPCCGGDIDSAGIANWIRQHLAISQDVIAIVESVHAMPAQGVSSVFTFGMGYGKVLGVLGALGVRTELATPQAWKKVILPGLIASKPKLPDDATAAQKKAAKLAHRKAGKDAAIAWCRRAYPSVELIQKGDRTPHDGCSDALAICEFGRLKFGCTSPS